MNQKVKKRKGFTLIELIIVLAVMAIIGAIAIPNFTSVRDNAKTKADKQSIETIKRSVLMLVADGTVPTPASTTSHDVSVDASGTVSVTNDTADGKIKEALKNVKKAQSTTGNYTVYIGADGSVEVTVGTISTTP